MHKLTEEDRPPDGQRGPAGESEALALFTFFTIVGQCPVDENSDICPGHSIGHGGKGNGQEVG